MDASAPQPAPPRRAPTRAPPPGLNLPFEVWPRSAVLLRDSLLALVLLAWGALSLWTVLNLDHDSRRSQARLPLRWIVTGYATVAGLALTTAVVRDLIAPRPRLRMDVDGVQLWRLQLLRVRVAWSEIASVDGSVHASESPWVVMRLHGRRNRAAGDAPQRPWWRRWLVPGRIRIDARRVGISAGDLRRALRVHILAHAFAS